MWWKIALAVLAVAAFIYVTYMYIKSVKEFADITKQLKAQKEENNEKEE